MANYTTIKFSQIGVMPITYTPYPYEGEGFISGVQRLFIEKGLRTEIPAKYFNVQFDDAKFVDIFSEEADCAIFDTMLSDEDLKYIESVHCIWDCNCDNINLTEVKIDARGDDPTRIRDWVEGYFRKHEDEIRAHVAELAYNILIAEADQHGLFEVSYRPSDDTRWFALYAPDAFEVDECSDIIYNGECKLVDLRPAKAESEAHSMWRDEVIRRASNLDEGRVWRNYTDSCEALSFVCYALDHQWGYDRLMQRIGMDENQHKAERSLFLPEGMAMGNAAPTAPQKTTSNNNIKPTNNNTTMAQTNNTPSGWKAQPATAAMTAAEYETAYFDRFFKEQLAKVKLDGEGHSLLDLPCERTWSCNEKGSIVALTLKMEGFESQHSYDLANNGSRNNITTIGGVKYVWLSLAKMAEAILKFDGTTPPADIQDYIKNKLGGKERKTAPTAKTRTAAPQTAQTPAAPQTAPTPAPQTAPAIAPKTDPCGAYFKADEQQFYYLKQQENGNLSVFVIGTDGALRQKMDNLDFEKVTTYCATKMQRVEMSDTLKAALVKAGAISAMTVEQPAPIAEPEPKAEDNDAEIAAAAAEIAAKAEEARKAAEAKKKAEEERIAQEAARKERERIEAEQKAAAEKAAAEQAKVVPFTLPGAITISDVKEGSLTLNGLTDLTAEQVSIFVAGMNAMREAIRKQMETA